MARTKATLGAGARLSDYLSASLLARVYPPELVSAVLDAHGVNSRRIRSFPAIAAAVVTPPDAVSMLALLIPMCLLYEVGIIAARFFASVKVPDEKTGNAQGSAVSAADQAARELAAAEDEQNRGGR